MNRIQGKGHGRSHCSSAEFRGWANCACQTLVFLSLLSLYITLSLLQSTWHEKQMGCLSQPSLKNHYHPSLPDLSLSKPGIHLASKSSQLSINQSIEPSIFLQFSCLYFIKISCANCVLTKNLIRSPIWCKCYCSSQVLICQLLKCVKLSHSFFILLSVNL